MTASSYYHKALILRCDRMLGFVSEIIGTLAGLAQSELKDVAIGTTIINCKLLKVNETKFIYLILFI